MDTQNTTPQPFIGTLIGSTVAKTAIEFGIKKGLEAFAKRNGGLPKATIPEVTKVVAAKVEKEVQSRIDHVTDNEPAYSSRNVWGAIVGIITAAEIIRQLWLDGVPNTAEDYLLPIGAIITALTPLYSRYIAKKPLWGK